MAEQIKKLITVVSPVYNNSESLVELNQRIQNIFIGELKDYSLEIIFVNDGSKDNSLEVLTDLQEQYKNVRIVSFSRNFGQLYALLAGFRYAKGDAMVCISADLQDRPEMIIEMVTSWEQKNRVVICYRKERYDSLSSRFFSSVFYNLMRQIFPNMPKGGFDYLLLDRKPLDIYNSYQTKHRFFQGDILSLGFKIDFIPYARESRKHGKSQFTFSKRFKFFLDGTITSTHLPLRFMSILGATTAFFGFLYSLVIVYLRIINDLPFKGYAVIVILILMIGGLTMLMLGIIGEYIWRIYGETQKYPIYIVEEEKNIDK